MTGSLGVVQIKSGTDDCHRVCGQENDPIFFLFQLSRHSKDLLSLMKEKEEDETEGAMTYYSGHTAQIEVL